MVARALGNRIQQNRPAGNEDIEHHFASGWSVVWSASEEKVPEKLPPGATANWYRLKRKLR